MIKKCVGCGIVLQNDDPLLDGYTPSLSNDKCVRCHKISNYGECLDTNRGNKDYTKILDSISDNDLVVYVSSILNLNINYINKFKNVLLVVTKFDILPKSLNEEKLKNNVLRLCDTSKIIDVLFVSSLKNYNIDRLYNLLRKLSFKNIYFVGATNSGKSSLINKLVSDFTEKKALITTSVYPSTTIDTIDININDLHVVDTPGIVESGSITNYVSSSFLKLINPKKEIKPKVYQLKGVGSLLFGEFLRLDYDVDTCNIVIFISQNIKISKISLKNEKLTDFDKRDIIVRSNEDLVIEDLCFIKFTNNAKLRIYLNERVNVYTRNNLIGGSNEF